MVDTKFAVILFTENEGLKIENKDNLDIKETFKGCEIKTHKGNKLDIKLGYIELKCSKIVISSELIYCYDENGKIIADGIIPETVEQYFVFEIIGGN